MTLKEQLQNDIKTAMKEGSSQKRDTLRGLISAMKSVEIPTVDPVTKQAVGGGPLTEEGMQKVLAKEIKNRKKAIELFKQGNRQDLIDQYDAEIKILEPYVSAPVG